MRKHNELCAQRGTQKTVKKAIIMGKLFNVRSLASETHEIVFRCSALLYDNSFIGIFIIVAGYFYRKDRNEIIITRSASESRDSG